MKRYLLGILFILIISTIKTYCQDDDNEYADPTLSLDLSNTIYSSLFSNTCSGTKSTNTDFINPIYHYWQLVEPWGSDPYGGTSCSDHTISGSGCALTCMTMILKSGGEDVDPETMQNWMSTNKWFTSNFTKGVSDHCGCLCGVDWTAVNYYGSKTFYQKSLGVTEDYKLLRSTIEAGGYVIVHGNDKKLISCQHWFLVYGYTGDGIKDDDFLVSDPEYSTDTKDDGTSRTLADHVLCATTKVSAYNYHYYEPSAKKKGKIMVNGLDAKGVRLPKGVALGTCLFIDMKKSASTVQGCNETIWAMSDASGNIIDSQVGGTNYNPSTPAPGTYSISVAVSDADGIWTDVVQVIIDPDATISESITINPDGSRNGDCSGCVPPPCTAQAPNAPYTLNKMSTSYTFTVWWPTVNCATSYKVYVNGSLVASPNTSSYKAFGLNTSTTFDVQVSAVNSYGESAKSPVVHVTTLLTPLKLYAAYSYVGNCGNAAAMNSSFQIQDHSFEAWQNPFVWVCWDSEHDASCGSYEDNAGERWEIKNEWYKTVRWTPDGYKEYPYYFNQMLPVKILPHTYTAEGTYKFRYQAWPGSDFFCYGDGYNGDTDCSGNIIMGTANIVDCSKSRNSTQLASSFNYKSDLGHTYYAGSFILNGLSQITENGNDYNHMQLILSACNSIELDPGVTLAPSGSGNYIQLDCKVENIPAYTIPTPPPSYKSANIDDTIAISTANENVIKIYPNPTTGLLNIETSEEKANMGIYNIYGSLLKQQQLLSKLNQIDIRDLQSGSYIIKVVTNSGQQKTQLIIKN